MSFVKLEEKSRTNKPKFEAVLFATLGQRAEMVESISSLGDEDVIFRHNPGIDGTPEEDESYILIAGENEVTRLFVGQWLVRYIVGENHTYEAYDVDDFNHLFAIVEGDNIDGE